jgi:hypothetical protein
MDIIKKRITINAGEDVGQKEPSYTLSETSGNQYGSSSKT